MAWDFIKTGNVDPSSSGGALREYFKDTVGIGEKGWEQDVHMDSLLIRHCLTRISLEILLTQKILHSVAK